MIELEDRLYTSTEVAEILGVSLRSVYRYIEDSKLVPDVKTATGRHRFTKQNILDFLYPGGERAVRQAAPAQRAKEAEVPEPTPSVRRSSAQQAKVEGPMKEPEVEVEEEPVDWLSKFREAAKKFKEEQPQEERPFYAQEVKVSSEPAFSQEDTYTRLTDLAGGPQRQREQPGAQEERGVFIRYYRSGLGGLKDVAQNIDKKARNAGMDYVFTLHAGLSLYKPIKPFSLLHVYVHSKDMDFFEKALMLTPADESNAQLCLMVSNDERIFRNKEEMHGLFVVSKTRLREDVQNYGDDSLRDESKSILS